MHIYIVKLHMVHNLVKLKFKAENILGKKQLPFQLPKQCPHLSDDHQCVCRLLP
jgi:hypothetical protein